MIFICPFPKPAKRYDEIPNCHFKKSIEVSGMEATTGIRLSKKIIVKCTYIIIINICLRGEGGITYGNPVVG
jgi:hypothetical protein